MRRILIPADGSEPALRAVRYATSLSDKLKDPMEVLLLNVQYPLPAKELLTNGRPSEVRQLEEPLREMGEKLLTPASDAPVMLCDEPPFSSSNNHTVRRKPPRDFCRHARRAVE